MHLPTVDVNHLPGCSDVHPVSKQPLLALSYLQKRGGNITTKSKPWSQQNHLRIRMNKEIELKKRSYRGKNNFTKLQLKFQHIHVDEGSVIT